MNFHAGIAQHYLDVSTRLRGRPALPGTDLLPRDAVQRRRSYTWSEPHLCVDPVPDQRGLDADRLQWLRPEIMAIATRRATAVYARMRVEDPGGRPIRQVKAAVATAFKIDRGVLFSRRVVKGAALPRQIAMMLAMRLSSLPRVQVGVRFERNPATVLFAERKMGWLVDGASSQIGGA